TLDSCAAPYVCSHFLRNLSVLGSGAPRAPVQLPRTGSARPPFTIGRNRTRSEAAPNAAGLSARFAYAFIARRSIGGVRSAATARSRQYTSSSGIGIRTGHTSAQAPQRLEAKGSGMLSSRPRIAGARIAPIGPEYAQP